MKDNKDLSYAEVLEAKRERAAQAKSIIETMDESDVDVLFAALMDALIDKETDIAFNLSTCFASFNKVLDGVIGDFCL